MTVTFFDTTLHGFGARVLLGVVLLGVVLLGVVLLGVVLLGVVLGVGVGVEGVAGTV